jgi:putative oxidoreductase
MVLASRSVRATTIASYIDEWFLCGAFGVSQDLIVADGWRHFRLMVVRWKRRHCEAMAAVAIHPLDWFEMSGVLSGGIGCASIALTMNRVAVGLFFVLSGYHKLFNARRHRLFVNELQSLRVPGLGFTSWAVPLVEFAAGACVVVGLVAPLAAIGLLVIMLVALGTSGRARIRAIKPIDEADRIDDWLYLSETLYALMLILIISIGAGPYSLDARLWALFTHASS